MPFEKLYRYCLYCIAFLIPSGFFGLSIAFIYAAGFCLLYDPSLRNGLKWNRPQVYLPVSLYLYLVISGFVAGSPDAAISGVSVYSPILLYPIFLASSQAGGRETMWKVNHVFLASTVLFLLIVFGYAVYDISRTGASMVHIGDSDYPKYGLYGLTRLFKNWHPTYVALFVNHSILILVKKLFDRRVNSKWEYAAIPVLFIFLSGSVFLLESVIGIVAYLVILMYAAGLYLKELRILIAFKILISLAVLIAAFAFVYENPLKIQKIESLKTRELKMTDNFEERNVLNIRMAKWDAHLSIISEHFLFGSSVNLRKYREKEYLRKNYQDLALHKYNAHNQFIEIFAIAGLIGFIVFMGILFVPLISGKSSSFYPAFILVVCITFLAESVFSRQQGLHYFMFFYALYAVTRPVEK